MPHFYLSNAKYKHKHVIVEVNADIKLEGACRFRLFLDTYGRLCHLIVAVDDLQIRKWNEYDTGAQVVFHDIWFIDGVEFLLQYLKMLNAND